MTVYLIRAGIDVVCGGARWSETKQLCKVDRHAKRWFATDADRAPRRP